MIFVFYSSPFQSCSTSNSRYSRIRPIGEKWANIRRFHNEIERMRVCEILRWIPTRQIETGLRGGPGPNNRYYKQHLYCTLLQRKLFSTLWQICSSPFFFSIIRIHIVHFHFIHYMLYIIGIVTTYTETTVL